VELTEGKSLSADHLLERVGGSNYEVMIGVLEGEKGGGAGWGREVKNIPLKVKCHRLQAETKGGGGEKKTKI